MHLRKFMAAITLIVFACLFGGSAALAAGTQTARGTMTFAPKVPVAEQPMTLTIRMQSDSGAMMPGGTVTGTFKQAGQPPMPVTFTEKDPGVYVATATFAARDWHGALNFNQGPTKLTADVGFTVFASAEQSFGVADNFALDWRSAGVMAPPKSADTVTWLLLVGLPIVLAALLWQKQGAGNLKPTLVKAKSLVPGGLLTVATLGALAQAFSAYWDITWHHDRGRDGLISAPHLGIYGGIIFALLALAVGVWTSGGLQKVRQVPAMVFTMITMLIQLASAPIDELWHRLMGLDISVWAPPHDMLIMGAALSAIGLATIQAAADPTAKSVWTRIRIYGFVAAALGVLNAFLAEFEMVIPAWHVSQSRPVALYPLLTTFAVVLCATVAARLTGARWAATKTVGFLWLLRAGEIAFFLPAMGRTQPTYPALIMLVGALVIDLVVQAKVSQGRYRFALAGLAAALGMFATYIPLSAVLPIKAVPAINLLIWLPLALAVGAAMGYLGGWLGDFVTQAAPAPSKTSPATQVREAHA